MNIIEANNLYKTYNKNKPNEVQALRGASISVSEKEMVSIVGPSGSGKSTLLHILSCLDNPDSGSVKISGIDLGTLSGEKKSKLRRSNIGIVIQDFGLLGERTALYNVSLPLILNKVDHKQAKQKASEALRSLGIGELENRKANQMSGGQQQRVAIARAIALEPKLILADEPTGALDSDTTLELFSLLKTINDRGISILIVTHNEIIANKCMRKYVMKDGVLFT